MLEKLSGKKTLIGSLLLALLGLIGCSDALLHGEVAWLTAEQYTAIGAFIAGLTGAAMRLGLAKVEKNGKAPPAA